MTDGIVAFNLNGDVIHYNPAAERILNEKKFARDYKYYAEKFGISFTLKNSSI